MALMVALNGCVVVPHGYYGHEYNRYHWAEHGRR
jgi:hypothetical protein